MPHGRQLSRDERRLILNLHHRGDSPDEIAEVVGRVRGTIHSVIRNPNRLEALPRSGRPSKLSVQDRRNLLRKARTGNFFAREIVNDLGLPICVSYARQILSQDPHLRFRTMKKKPHMTARHFQPRLAWANEHVGWSLEQWKTVIWSDEKKFNLDGPDGRRHYWHDRRLPRKIFSKRHSGGGSIMVWGCFSGAGVGQLCELNGRLTSVKYIDILEEYMLPHAYAHHGTEHNSFIFQQDGASAHRARATLNWLDNLGVQLMQWPAISPDMNPMENVWGVMAQEVYSHGRRQFMTIDDLRQCVHQTWNNLSANYIDELNKSMHDRCVELLRKNGRATDY